VDVEPIHELQTVCFGGLDADFEQMGDLLRIPALGDELEDFTLAIRELVVRTFVSRGTLKVFSTTVSRTDGLRYVWFCATALMATPTLGGGVFQQVTGGPPRRARKTYSSFAYPERMSTLVDGFVHDRATLPARRVPPWRHRGERVWAKLLHHVQRSGHFRLRPPPRHQAALDEHPGAGADEHVIIPTK